MGFGLDSTRPTPHGVSLVINLVEADELRVDIIGDAIRVPGIEGPLQVCETVKSLLSKILAQEGGLGKVRYDC